MKITANLIFILLALLLISCGGGGGNTAPMVINSANSVAPVSTSNTVTTSANSSVTISGKITFDNISHNSQNSGLDYTRITPQAAQGIVVMMLNAQNEILGETLTDDTGDYAFTAESDSEIKIQARAQLKSANDNWNVRVSDNTSQDALYVIEGSLLSSGSSSAQTRDLHASSGWDGSRYAETRAAAPFAILNSIYQSVQSVVSVDPDAQMPDLNIHWSTRNRPIIGDTASGHIGTSSFRKDENAIYILGEEGRDTDEYDRHVIVHEWGHYFEHNLSRLDSLGGLHSLSDKLDPRLAFSEGWSNALAAIVTEDPNYKDSFGIGQSGGFDIDFENLHGHRPGWFNEGSVAAIIYDIFDEQQDGNDFISLGFEPIYKAMTDPVLRNGEVFTTIFSFSDALNRQSGINEADYRQLLATQSITASDSLGRGESNDGTIASALPVYKEAKIEAQPVVVCSVDDAGSFNKLGNREFVFFTISQAGNYTISMSFLSGDDDRDPDFNLWQQGNVVMRSEASGALEETFTGRLETGSYVAEVYDFFNINGASNRRGDACFEFSVSST